MESKNGKAKKKTVKFVFEVKNRHWVGDGFYVHGIVRPSEETNQFISPFILMDYASPKEFPITIKRRGVGVHPHRGFETVTVTYQGEVEHRDSSGGGGIIRPGDVQWMTAGSGIVHDEFHSDDFSNKGGVFEMVQLWVNLPKKNKMTKPKYQSIESKNIPKINIGNGSEIRVIAGEFEGTKGPANTFSYINMYDIVSKLEDKIKLSFKEFTNTILLVMDGKVQLNEISYSKQTVLIFDPQGEEIELNISKNFKGLFLNGNPLNEPLVAHGPFVMNTKNEIMEAIRDYQDGKMGKL